MKAGAAIPSDLTPNPAPFAPWVAGLHSRDKYAKWAMYWPRKAPFMDWWREMEKNTISWADIDTDLVQMKSVLGINTVRIFTYYDHVFRGSAGAIQGWTDGAGNHNATYLGWLSTFIDKCAALGLDVVVTMYQLLPALLSTDDWTFLERDIAYYRSFHRWMLTLLNTKPNVRLYNLINEPDGYGVANDAVLFGRVLTFLNDLKNTGKAVAPRLAAMVNTTTHDNNFKRYASGPAGATSVYELTDILAANTFLWADTGFWPGQNYGTQIPYLVTNNTMGKPVMITECGFPVGYAQQDVAGSPALNEDGSATGAGNAPTTIDSIVPQGGIFDRPKGTANGMPHTDVNQARGIGEAAYWAWFYGASVKGMGVWAAYDHRNDAAGFVYRDPFGVIDRDGTPRLGAATFKGAMSGNYDGNGEFKMSLIQGTVGGTNSRINGLGSYTLSPDRTLNTPGGVYIAPSGNWKSDYLVIGMPCKLKFDLTQRITNSASEPFIIRLLPTGRTLDYRYKVYGVSAFQRLDAGAGDVNYGWAQSTPFAAGTHTFIIDLTQSAAGGILIRITHNGTLLNFDNTPSGELLILPWQANKLQIQFLNNGNSGMDLNTMVAMGTAGAPIPFVPRKPG